MVEHEDTVLIAKNYIAAGPFNSEDWNVADALCLLKQSAAPSILNDADRYIEFKALCAKAVGLTELCDAEEHMIYTHCDEVVSEALERLYACEA